MDIDFEEYGRIICAALLHDECICMSKKGHYAIFPMEPIGVLRNAIQGFVTENGYFVARNLGLSIAIYFNQIDIKHPPIDILLSEDLKKEDLKVLRYVKKYSYKERQK